MKSFFLLSMYSVLLFSVLIQGCTSENIDSTSVVELPLPIDSVSTEDPIVYSVSSISQQRVAEGKAYALQNGDNTLFVLASSNVAVACPGDLSTSFDGGEDYFQFHFIQTPSSELVFLANFNSVVDTNVVTLFSTVPPNCAGLPFEIDYQVINNRIKGTVTGEFFYFNPIYVAPFDNCDNFISVGLVDVAFDLPLTDCN